MLASDEKIAEVKSRCGRTIGDLLAKEAELGIYKVLGAIEILVCSKMSKNLQTSAAEKMIFALVWLAREVNNGGFNQFFVNSAGDFWGEVLYGLEVVGDERGLELFRQVLSIFPESSPSADRETRLIQLEELEEADEERLSTHFNKADDSERDHPCPDWVKVFNFVKTHPGEFDFRNA